MIESAGDRPVRAVTALMSSCRVTSNIVSAKSPSDHSFLSARVFTDLHPCPEHRLAVVLFIATRRAILTIPVKNSANALLSVLLMI